MAVAAAAAAAVRQPTYANDRAVCEVMSQRGRKKEKDYIYI